MKKFLGVLFATAIILGGVSFISYDNTKVQAAYKDPGTGGH